MKQTKYKFYVCLFENKVYTMPDPNKVFVKFGITHHWDVMDRFNPNVDDGYAKNYDHWNIACKFSWQLPTKGTAEKLERYWLEEQYPNPGPNKVWVEQYLGVPDNNFYYDNTGITELRLLTKKQAGWVYRTMHEMKSENMKMNFG